MAGMARGNCASESDLSGDGRFSAPCLLQTGSGKNRTGGDVDGLQRWTAEVRGLWNHHPEAGTSRGRTAPVAPQPHHSMSFLKLTTAFLGATAAITAVFSQPVEAQMYGYGNSYQQNIQRGRLSMPSQSGGIYRSNPPVMQQPNFGQQQRQPSQRGFGYSNGSYFGF